MLYKILDSQNFRPLPPHIPSDVANGIWVLFPIAKNQTNFVFLFLGLLACLSLLLCILHCAIDVNGRGVEG
jgi:hypothetical protein